MTTTDSPGARTGRNGRPAIGELVVDAVIVVGSALYLWTAQSYPKDGREIPTVVGVIALAVGIVQLVGWFVPRMWTLTHGSPTAASPPETRPGDRPGAPPGGSDTEVDGTDVAEATAVPTARQQNRDTVIIMAWAAGFLGAILVLGYRYAVPLFFLAYFGARRQWRLAVGSAVVMWAVTQFVFIDLLGINLPTSQIFVF